MTETNGPTIAPPAGATFRLSFWIRGAWHTVYVRTVDVPDGYDDGLLLTETAKLEALV